MSRSRLDRLERLMATHSSPVTAPELVVPNVIDFTMGSDYLAWPSLYPAQAFLLKLIFLQLELFTSFDIRLMDRWTDGMPLRGQPGSPDYGFHGSEGLPGDIYFRAQRCLEEGRRWFREVLLVVGRRGGKGFLGAVCAAYVLWHFLALGDPQAHYGFAPGKQLRALVFAGKRAQAQANQFADLVSVISRAPCFAPFIAGVTGSSLTLYSPRQLAEGDLSRELPAFELAAVESTNLAGRGPTAFLIMFDEMAHVVNSGTTRSAGELYRAATPALAQFGHDAFIYEASSPWTRTGMFHENYQRALAASPATGEAINHDLFVVQTPSWGMYEGWARTQ
jgi:hypothetical protein